MPRRDKIDLTNQRFGKWLVLYEAEPVFRGSAHKKITRWHCRCDCGLERDIDGGDLRGGRTLQCKYCAGNQKSSLKPPKIKSPNVSRSNVIDETGRRYGRLTVISQSKSDKRGAAMWMCQCDCGNTITLKGNELRNGHAMSCGCLSSKGEAQIASILDANNIKYKRQYFFKDLVSKRGGVLKFDFGILDENDNLLWLIEYQGSQHYEGTVIPSWWNSPIENDKLKRAYCREHNIPLIEISYTQYNSITIDQLIVQRL